MSEKVRIRCTNVECGQKLRVPKANAGKDIHCPSCGRPIRVPAETERIVVGIDADALTGLADGPPAQDAAERKPSRLIAVRRKPRGSADDTDIMDCSYWRRRAEKAHKAKRPGLLQTAELKPLSDGPGSKLLKAVRALLPFRGKARGDESHQPVGDPAPPDRG
jgi:hypothetical protein